MDSKHTPGPWIATDGPDPEVITPDGTTICSQVCSGADDEPDNDGRTNARLISAAPDLLAACEAALCVHDVYSTAATPRLLPEVAEKLRAAIAKARA